MSPDNMLAGRPVMEMTAASQVSSEVIAQTDSSSIQDWAIGADYIYYLCLQRQGRIWCRELITLRQVCGCTHISIHVVYCHHLPASEQVLASYLTERSALDILRILFPIGK